MNQSEKKHTIIYDTTLRDGSQAEGVSFTVTAKLAETPLPQLLMPFTETSPETALAEKLTVMLLVLLPEAMLAPGGTDQLYPVALAMAATE